MKQCRHIQTEDLDPFGLVTLETQLGKEYRGSPIHETWQVCALCMGKLMMSAWQVCDPLRVEPDHG